MRLIELRFKNLNSLKGEWRIDFNDKAFVDEGIFAITGQTGAGKTTILDAICLALYGATPRLGEISSANDVMTRQTGDCYAEVVIDLNGEHYRCRWGQRRAYYKPDGKLQSATHELAKINMTDPTKGDEILEEKLSLTKKKIIELTSMDFQQFTRSILLAQGSFSAFLQAKSDERADILEKITGTAIYATISQRTFEKMRTEEMILNELKANLQGLSLLSMQEETQLKLESETYKKQLSDHRSKLESLDKKIKWCEEVSDLTKQLTEFQLQLQNSQQDAEDFKDQALRLENANKALEIEAIYNRLQDKRNFNKDLLTQQQSLLKQIPVAEQQLQTTLKELTTTQQQQQTANNELSEALPIIAKTRTLDHNISQQQSLLDENIAQRTKLTSVTTDIKLQQQQHIDAQANYQRQLTQLNQYFTDNSHHQQLSDDITSFDSLCVQLKTSLQRNSESLATKNDKLVEKEEHNEKLASLHSAQINLNDQLQQKQTQLNKLQQQQTSLLQGHSVSTLRTQQEHTEQVSSWLRQFHQQLDNLAHLRHKFAENKQQSANLTDQALLITQRMTTDSTNLDDLKARRKDKQLNLEQQQHILQLTAKLEDYRDLLENNKPCPLCGSTQHPYQHSKQHLESETNTDSAEADFTHPYKKNAQQQALLTQINTDIQVLEQQIEQLTTKLSQQNVELATVKHDLKQKQQQLTDFTQQLSVQLTENLHQLHTFRDTIQPYAAAIIDILQQKHTIASIESLLTMVGDMDVDNLIAISQIETAIASLQTTINALDVHKNQLRQTIDQNDALTTDIQQIETEIRDLESNKQSVVIDSHSHKSALTYLEENIEQLDAQTNSHFKVIGDTIKQLYALLDNYKDSESSQFNEQVTDKHTPSESELETKKNPTAHLQNAIDTLNQLQISIDNKQPLANKEYESILEPLRSLRQWLKSLRDTYNAKKELKHDISSQLKTLEVQISDKQHQIKSNDDDIQQLTINIEQQSKQIAQLRQQRMALFSDKDIDAEENHLRLRLDEVNKSLANIKEKNSATEYKLQQLTENNAQVEKQLTELGCELQQLQCKFSELLTQYQFDDETAFIQARLSKDERDTLNNQQQQISQALKFAENAVLTTTTKLDKKLANRLTEEDESVLISERQQLEISVVQLSQTLGAINQQLATNEKNKEKQQVQLQKIDKQGQNLIVWQQLNELIGSATGKKFRTFAQGLTFEIMIANANTQLNKMSDRYLLIRDENSPLELNVIDDYQGGLQRSTKNLSGGEGFIISLALALGLSKMASHNIRVDSLFLDEGFGTLDEDSLDIALDTLTNLQQEGKLIGVISHVQALKERIHTQIKVEKLSGGHSQLSGPGCQRL